MLICSGLVQLPFRLAVLPIGGARLHTSMVTTGSHSDSCNDAAEQFVWALAGGDVMMVKQRFQGHEMLRHVSLKFGPPLAVAVRRGDADILSWLLDQYGAEIPSYPHHDLLAIAVNHGNLASIRLLMKAGIRPGHRGRVHESSLRRAAAVIPELWHWYEECGELEFMWRDLDSARFLRSVPDSHPSRHRNGSVRAALEAVGWFEDTTPGYRDEFPDLHPHVDRPTALCIPGGFFTTGVYPDEKPYRHILGRDGLAPLPFGRGPTGIVEQWTNPQNTSRSDVTVSFTISRRAWTATWPHRSPVPDQAFLSLLHHAVVAVEPTARLAIIHDNGRYGRLIVHRKAALLAARESGILPLDLVAPDGSGFDAAA